jgi:Multiubiquitin
MSNKQSDEMPGHNKAYSIIVNGRPRQLTEHELTYRQLVQLAFPGEQLAPGKVYTVTYSNPHGKDGSLVDGQQVEIKDGMIFNVNKTDQS